MRRTAVTCTHAIATASGARYRATLAAALESFPCAKLRGSSCVMVMHYARSHTGLLSDWS
jgi:hypothetical protein